MTDSGARRLQTDAASTELPTDFELLMRVQMKDEAALADLYDRFGGLLFTLALRIVGDQGLAQEVMQDTFLRCWDRAERYDPARGGVVAWLMGVTRNRAIDVLRGRQHQSRLRENEALPESGAAGEPSESDSSEIVVAQQVVRAALNELSLKQRKVIELAYYGGLSQSEIALQLDEPLGTVKTRIRVAMAKLRDVMRPDGKADLREASHGRGS